MPRNQGRKIYPMPVRIKALHQSGELSSYTKLQGKDEIAWYLQWSMSKLQMRLPDLQESGVVFKENMGGVHSTVWCSYPELILRYVSLCGKAKRHI